MQGLEKVGITKCRDTKTQGLGNAGIQKQSLTMPIGLPQPTSPPPPTNLLPLNMNPNIANLPTTNMDMRLLMITLESTLALAKTGMARPPAQRFLPRPPP